MKYFSRGEEGETVEVLELEVQKVEIRYGLPDDECELQRFVKLKGYPDWLRLSIPETYKNANEARKRAFDWFQKYRREVTVNE